MQGASLLSTIRAKLGGRVYDGGRRWLGPGPSHSKRDSSLSVRVAPSGRVLVWSFAGDPVDACMKHLGLADAGVDPSPDVRTYVAERRQIEREERETRRRKAEFCAETWAATYPADDTPVAAYLREARSLPLVEVPPVLRFHPACPMAYPWSAAGQRNRTSPAMVAIIAGPGGEGAGLHVTPLTMTGARSGAKLMFGQCIEGAARLFPIADDRRLAVTEGIETALAFQSLRGVATWAALSTAGLRRLRVPSQVRELVIGADSDDRGAGREAAVALAERVRCAATVEAAPDGKDWADVVREAAR